MAHDDERHARSLRAFNGVTAASGFFRDGGVMGQQALPQAHLAILPAFPRGRDAQIRVAQKGNGAYDKFGPSCRVAQGDDFLPQGRPAGIFHGRMGQGRADHMHPAAAPSRARGASRKEGES